MTAVSFFFFSSQKLRPLFHKHPLPFPTGGAAPSAPPAGYPPGAWPAQGGLRYGYPGAAQTAQYPPGAQQYPPTAGAGYYAGAAGYGGGAGQMPPQQYYGQQPGGGVPPQGYGQGAPMYAG